MKEAEPRLAAEVQRWLTQAAQTDKAEDGQLGASKGGDEMPEWMVNKETKRSGSRRSVPPRPRNRAEGAAVEDVLPAAH
jgi:hypothetical protein